MVFEKENIYKIIPNRYPLMILDRLEILEKHNGGGITSCISDVLLDKDLWFFKCHYPDYPVMPLCLIIECMTQTFSATFLSGMQNETEQNKTKQEIPVIYQLGEIKLKKSAFPGDKLHFKADLLSFRRGIAKGNCRVYLNDNEEIGSLEIVEALPSQMVKI